MAQALYKIKGINDDQSTCDVCGKEHLQRVVWLESVETGDILAAGTTCAARLQGYTVKEQVKREKDFAAQQLELAKAELWPFQQAATSIYTAAPQTSGPNAVPFMERIMWVRNHPATVALEAARSEIRAKYNVKHI